MQAVAAESEFSGYAGKFCCSLRSEIKFIDGFLSKDQRFTIDDLSIFPNRILARFTGLESYARFDLKLAGELEMGHVGSNVAKFIRIPQSKRLLRAVLDITLNGVRQRKTSRKDFARFSACNNCPCTSRGAHSGGRDD